MRTLYKTSEVIMWLYKHDCITTATTIKDFSQGADFLDSSVLRKYLVPELYDALQEEINKSTYKTKSLW